MMYHNSVFHKEAVEALNINPEGAKLLEIKKKFLFLNINPLIDNKVIDENIPSEIQAAGT